jgi:hypothetical protein
MLTARDRNVKFCVNEQTCVFSCDCSACTPQDEVYVRGCRDQMVVRIECELVVAMNFKYNPEVGPVAGLKPDLLRILFYISLYSSFLSIPSVKRNSSLSLEERG